MRGARANQIYANKINKHDQCSLTFSAEESVCVYMNAGMERGAQLNVRCDLGGRGGGEWSEPSGLVSFYRAWSITELLPDVTSQRARPQRPICAAKRSKVVPGISAESP